MTNLPRSPQINPFYKGGLILEIFSLWLKSPQKGAKNYPKPFPTKENTEDSFLTPLLRDLSHSEKLSEIKSPLEMREIGHSCLIY